VCSGCSPHRITIPRQFIVRPDFVDLTSGDDVSSPSQPSWGGEEVRVCNPCVPDPNLNPPGGASHAQYALWQQASQGSAFPSFSPPPAANRDMWPPSSQTVTFQSPSSVRDLWPPTAPPNAAPPHFLPGPPQMYPPAGGGPAAHQHRHTQSHGGPAPLRFAPRAPPPPLPHHQQRHSQQVAGPAYYYPSAVAGPSSLPPTLRLATNPPLPGYPVSPHRAFGGPAAVPEQPLPSPPQPRREIPEEDECPVCGDELPARGPDGGEAARERHVEECIRGHMYGGGGGGVAVPGSGGGGAAAAGAPPAAAAASASLSSSSSSPPLPGLAAAAGRVVGLEGFVTAARAMAAAATGGASGPASAASSLAPSSSSLPAAGAAAAAARPRRMTGGRMLLFLATEKDCVDDAGAEAECVICLEEFEVGHEMGRLECLCKFHRVGSAPLSRRCRC
jgi:hypothetical protein